MTRSILAFFFTYLPASEAEVIEDKKPTGEVEKCEGTVLLVIDEEMITDVGEKILKHLAYRVIMAKSGKEAIDV